MISFVNSVCPARNVERDEDLIHTKKQYSHKCLSEIHLLSVVAESGTSHLVEKQQTGGKTNKELISFKIFW